MRQQEGCLWMIPGAMLIWAERHSDTCDAYVDTCHAMVHGPVEARGDHSRDAVVVSHGPALQV